MHSQDSGRVTAVRLRDHHARSGLRITEAAARAAAPWIGRGDKAAADRAAVDAMAAAFRHEYLRGRVVVGEGEKDGAPRFGIGQVVGAASGPLVDVAVDPVEGTRLVAEGEKGGMAALALAPSGTLLDLGVAFYMRKLVVGGIKAADLPADAVDRPPGAVLPQLASCLDKPVASVTVAVQRRPRNQSLIRGIRAAGAAVCLFDDGDLSYAVLAAVPDSSVDALWSIGGAPETVLAACALTGQMAALWGRLQPQGPAEAERIRAAGFSGDTVFSGTDLVATGDVVFAATGITPGPLFNGVQYENGAVRTDSLVAVSRSGTIRRAIRHWTPPGESSEQVS